MAIVLVKPPTFDGQAMMIRARLAITSNEGVSLEWDLEPGIMGVFGTTGAGKSTLLKAIAGLSKGQLIHLSVGHKSHSPADIVHNPCVYLSQQITMLPHLTVLENLTTVMRHTQWPNNLSLEQIISLIDIAHLKHRTYDQLSGGELQLFALARTLASGKPILLLDEPFTALDHPQRQRLLCTLHELQHTHRRRIVMVSHQLSDIVQFCATVLFLDRHRILAYGPTHKHLAKIQTHMQLPRSNSLLLTKDEERREITLQHSSTGLFVSSTIAIQTGRAELAADKITLSNQDLSACFPNRLSTTVSQIQQEDHCAYVTLTHQTSYFVASITTKQLAALELNVQSDIDAYFGPL